MRSVKVQISLVVLLSLVNTNHHILEHTENDALSDLKEPTTHSSTKRGDVDGVDEKFFVCFRGNYICNTDVCFPSKGYIIWCLMPTRGYISWDPNPCACTWMHSAYLLSLVPRGDSKLLISFYFKGPHLVHVNFWAPSDNSVMYACLHSPPVWIAL